MKHSEEDQRLLARAAAWSEDDERLPDAERLAAVARSEGLEFATALLYGRLLRVPKNAAFLGTRRSRS